MAVRFDVAGEGRAAKPSGVVVGDASGIYRGMMKGGEARLTISGSKVTERKRDGTVKLFCECGWGSMPSAEVRGKEEEVGGTSVKDVADGAEG